MSGNRFGPKHTADTPRAEVKSAFISPETKKLTVDLDADLHHQLKLAAVNQGRPMRAILEECLEKYFHN